MVMSPAGLGTKKAVLARTSRNLPDQPTDIPVNVLRKTQRVLLYMD
jgi:hypothetical protein